MKMMWASHATTMLMVLAAVVVLVLLGECGAASQLGAREAAEEPRELPEGLRQQAEALWRGRVRGARRTRLPAPDAVHSEAAIKSLGAFFAELKTKGGERVARQPLREQEDMSLRYSARFLAPPEDTYASLITYEGAGSTCQADESVFGLIIPTETCVQLNATHYGYAWCTNTTFEWGATNDNTCTNVTSDATWALQTCTARTGTDDVFGDDDGDDDDDFNQCDDDGTGDDDDDDDGDDDDLIGPVTMKSFNCSLPSVEYVQIRECDGNGASNVNEDNIGYFVPIGQCITFNVTNGIEYSTTSTAVKLNFWAGDNTCSGGATFTTNLATLKECDTCEMFITTDQLEAGDDYDDDDDTDDDAGTMNAPSIFSLSMPMVLAILSALATWMM